MTTAIFFALEGTLLVAPDETDDSTADLAVEDLQVPDGARAALSELATENHLGVITDVDAERAQTAIEVHDLPIETVVTAAEAGKQKVDGDPYDLARERVDAAEYVMVGDDYEADVEAARGAGFVPIHYEEEGPSLWKSLNALV